MHTWDQRLAHRHAWAFRPRARVAGVALRDLTEKHTNPDVDEASFERHPVVTPDMHWKRQLEPSPSFWGA
jgi:hypothetical protein